jgi:ribosomal protein S18 acetylase RimI-like enzyme
VIRQADLGDLEVLLPLVRGYREFYERPHDARHEREFLERHLRDRTSTIFIALRDERAVGFVQMFGTWSTVHLAPSFVLEDLFVEPQARGSGAADALLERALEHARESGAAGMFLETAADNEHAQRVYERNGWTREKRFLKYNAPL